MKKNVILIGAGGYSKSVLDSINREKYNVVGFIDEFKNSGEHLGYPILGKSLKEIFDPNKYCYFVSIGDNWHRKKWFDKIEELNLETINVIDNSAIVSSSASIGKGCFIGKMAIINSMSTIGNNCIINTKALIEHGCTIDDHVNVSTNTIINGDVRIGEGSSLYSSSVIIGQRMIGKWSIVGAGSVVIKDIPDGVVAVGVPSRIVKQAEYDK